MQAQDTSVKQKTVVCITAKEMKALVRGEFQSNPQKYYPTETFAKIGFTRSQCKCGHYFWRKSQNITTCGDSNCTGKYSFIGQGRGIGRTGQKLSYVGAWESFKKSLTTSRIPCTAIERYPVIARWRNDVDYVAAGIFCFQPYCVTGELDPPANPLICPQFCLRFNDLDNIGLTGRHFSGFTMLGIQVFNKPDKYIFFKDECVEFNYRWLTEQLKIDPEEITFIEDIWAGGGNLGPSIQYFIGGLELGNMVFMQYKYDHHGKYQELPVKVIDVGIGLQRIPWLINGSPTSYYDVFKQSFKFLSEKLQVPLNNDIWQKLGPYTCRLNVDQTDDIEKTWAQISSLINQPVQTVKKAILPVKQLYVILDHTRTALMIIQDGGLPSNVGGGSNCRNIIRRVFAIFKKNDWWKKIGQIDGLLELFEKQKQDLLGLFGKFPEYKSFGNIIKIEYERWSSTQVEQKKKLQQLFDKNKGKLSLDNWIMAMQSWGIPADAISQVCKEQIPGNLYSQIATRAEKIGKAQEAILYETIHFPQTENLYYEDHRMYQFKGKIVGVLDNVQEKQKGSNIVLLDRSAFYPTSGGQVNDIGSLQISGKVYEVYNVEKVGKCVLHYLGEAVNRETVIGLQAKGKIDQERRSILRCFHTGTHIVFAATRRVLGPHIWQHGAKKTINYAHLDITHYSSITKELQMQIQNEANKIILQGHPVKKYFQSKSQAEKQFGFRLYQGGIVPGNTIRVVNIQDVDVEACCGTHSDNTNEVGWIKIVKSARISDGTLRLYYMAGKKVMKALNEETSIINNLKDLWNINQTQIIPTAERFFNDFKKLDKQTQNQTITLLGIYSRYISQSKLQTFVVPSVSKTLKLYFASMNTQLVPIIESQKTVIFVSESLLFGIISKPQHLDIEKLKEILKESQEADFVDKKLLIQKGIQYGKGKQKISKPNAIQMSFAGKIKEKKLNQFFSNLKYQSLK